MMYEDLLNELGYTPFVVEPIERIPHNLVIGGMGGSALAGDALQFLELGRSIYVHRDYGVPEVIFPESLYIAVSYSGTTEESVDFAERVLSAGLPLAIITSGGVLAAFAKEHTLPHVLVPSGLAPRNALLIMVRALLALLHEDTVLDELARVSAPPALLEQAEQDAHFLLQSIPLLYASARNQFLARLLKLVLNESARTPAFMHTFPELNHNEMQSFDADMPEGLEHLFRFFMISDSHDDSRIQRRMEVFTSLMKEQGRLVHILDISKYSRAEALVQQWITFISIGRYLAQTRGVDPNTAPLVEAFKKAL